MNENTPKISRQKACAVRKWEEISKFGGEAPAPAEISECIRMERSTRLSREEVQRRVYQYLTSCMEKYEDEDTHETGYRWRKNPTKAGLARSVGVTPETLSRYLANHVNGNPYCADARQSVVSVNDFDIIRAAAGIIEEFYEQQLGKNRNNSGSIFWLLNAQTERWTNRQEVEMVNNDEMQKPLLSHEEIQQILDQAHNRDTLDLIDELPD